MIDTDISGHEFCPGNAKTAARSWKCASPTTSDDALMDEKQKDQLRSLVSRAVVSFYTSAAMTVAHQNRIQPSFPSTRLSPNLLRKPTSVLRSSLSQRFSFYVLLVPHTGSFTSAIFPKSGSIGSFTSNSGLYSSLHRHKWLLHASNALLMTLNNNQRWQSVRHNHPLLIPHQPTSLRHNSLPATSAHTLQYCRRQLHGRPRAPCPRNR